MVGPVLKLAGGLLLAAVVLVWTLIYLPAILQALIWLAYPFLVAVIVVVAVIGALVG